jgi:hypothetical protein
MGEDIDLCHRLSKSGIVFKCNQFSSVKLLKDKPLVGWENEISPDELKMLNEFDEEDLSFLFKKQEFTFSNWLSAIKMEKGYIPIVKGGMGNQMFIVAAAYVAHKSSGFPLYILKKHVSQNKHNVHRNDYNKSLFKYFGTHIDNNSNFLQYISYTEYNPPFFEKWLIPAPGALMVSHFMYYPNIAPFEHDICDLFLKGLEEFRGKLGDYSNYCFLHVRRGDFLDNSDIYVTQEVDYYSAAIEKMKPIKIIIVTNDIDWVRSHAVFDGIEIFEGNELETMALMTKCTAGAIIANSTFSWWGALLGAHLHKNTVIYPNAKNWYLTVDKLEIFPESWISLP